jgi:hypothetical protein
MKLVYFIFTHPIVRVSLLCLLAEMHNYVLIPCVEAGSNTSTVTLRVVGGDEKGSLNLRQ